MTKSMNVILTILAFITLITLGYVGYNTLSGLFHLLGGLGLGYSVALFVGCVGLCNYFILFNHVKIEP